jgi:predicted esterase
MTRSALCLLAGTLALAGQDEHPPRLEPTDQAPALTPHSWTTEDGLRFVWWLPEGYDRKKGRTLTVILHGTGLDYRWGLWNHRPGLFRPADIVVSVDGTSPGPGESRLFLGEAKDARSFKTFLGGMRKAFAVEQVLLYGHSQGGFFVVYYAGEHPETVDGVVAHASGAWTWSKTGPGARRVAIAFQHGTLDPVVPYGQSLAARDHFREAGFPLLHLRRLPRYNHWPNAVRSNESLGWARGMTTADPVAALAEAQEILRRKAADGTGYETPVGFSGARAILARFESASGFPKMPAPAVVAKARALAAKVDAHGSLHVRALKTLIAKRADLKLDGRPALGHLVSLREDFRGVPPVEEWAKALGLDDALAEHAKAAKPLFEAWYGKGSKAEIARAVLQALPRCFLYEAMPSDLEATLAAWKEDPSAIGLAGNDAALFRAFDSWREGWKSGLAAYERLWRDWE